MVPPVLPSFFRRPPETVSVKADVKEYLNSNLTVKFQPQNNNEIIKICKDAVTTQDEKIIAKAISETLPAKNDALLKKMKEYSPKTTEVQGLHNILIKAFELRKEAYAKILQVLTNNATDAEVNAAFAKLDESDAMFQEFLTKGETMKKDLGLADAK